MVELVQLLIAGVIWGVIWGSLCAWLAGQKGRDGTSWFILGFFFALIALIVLGFSPSADAIPSDTTTCPRCAETIKSAAVVCRFCGYEPPRTSAGQRTDEQPHPCWCDVIKGDHDIRDHPHHQSDAPTIGASRRSTRNSPWPAAPNYSGDWRVLVAEADGLTAGRILNADSLPTNCPSAR